MPRFRLNRKTFKRAVIFTPAGGAVLVIALIILIRSLVMRNSYEIVLSFGFLLLMLVLGVIGVWKSRKLKTMEPGWKTPFPMTANANHDSAGARVTGLEESIPLFFRIHFFVRGSFFPSGSKTGCPVLVETSVQRSKTSAHLPLYFPMSGIFRGEGYCRLRDIFGLFSIFCGQEQPRTVNIRCAPCFGKELRINAQSGAEDRRNKPSVDEERYYMREYTPGDRLRDINWKSSDRIDTLITRISTDTQERISRIEVHFRNFYQSSVVSGQRADSEQKAKNKKQKIKKERQDASLEALWILDRAKARLAYFLRSIKDQNSSFIFDVRTAQGNWEIEDDKDLDDFLEELAGFSFMPSKNEYVVPAGSGDLYIFSTSCDIGLPAFLLACNPRPVTLFMSQTGNLTANKDTEIICLTDFTSKGCIAPVSWFAGGKVIPLGVNIDKAEINYAGIKI